MELERPDLTLVDPSVRAYIEALETELQRLQPKRAISVTADSVPEPAPIPSEPPTPFNLITITAEGIAKRTPRHLYGRQHRGGMGVFDLETAESDPPTVLAVADEKQHLLLFTNYGRAFRLPVADVPETAVRAKGQSLKTIFQFRPHEKVVAALPDEGGMYVTLVSQRGWVRRIRSNYLGKSLIPGMSFHDVKEGGNLAAACWTPGDKELFMASKQGQGIRFLESQVPARGCLGMRVDVTDEVVAVTSVRSNSNVFLLGSDGKGVMRPMAAFAANKAPGSGGKAAFKSDKLVGAVAVADEQDLFIISQLSKIIRFPADEVPPKEGAVQGVNCMNLRGDEITAVTAS